jgi:hypothetical protein
MDPAEDADLRFYFETQNEPSDLKELVRWSRLRRLFRDSGWSDLEWELGEAYREGIVSFAERYSKAADDAYAVSHPEPPPAPIGGAAYADWVERDRQRETFPRWIRRLFAREASGFETGQDRLVLDHIRREVKQRVEDLVKRYEAKVAFVSRQDAREEAARLEAEARERAAKAGERVLPGSTAALPTQPSRRARRWGEQQPEPEIVVRRRTR